MNDSKDRSGSELLRKLVYKQFCGEEKISKEELDNLQLLNCKEGFAILHGAIAASIKERWSHTAIQNGGIDPSDSNRHLVGDNTVSEHVFLSAGAKMEEIEETLVPDEVQMYGTDFSKTGIMQDFRMMCDADSENNLIASSTIDPESFLYKSSFPDFVPCRNAKGKVQSIDSSSRNEMFPYSQTPYLKDKYSNVDTNKLYSNGSDKNGPFYGSPLYSNSHSASKKVQDTSRLSLLEWKEEKDEEIKFLENINMKLEASTDSPHVKNNNGQMYNPEVRKVLETTDLTAEFSTHPWNRARLQQMPGKVPVMSGKSLLFKDFESGRMEGPSTTSFPEPDNTLRLTSLPKSETAKVCVNIGPDGAKKFVWCGTLPDITHANPIYSSKVFLGGVPWDITDVELKNSFAAFGEVEIKWPKGNSPKPGFVFVLFQNRDVVDNFLKVCHSNKPGEYHFRLSSRTRTSKLVEVVPWAFRDNRNILRPTELRLPTFTAFIGGIHGRINAKGLTQIIDDVFGSVVYALIDSDRLGYPVGSGRVAFCSYTSFLTAIQAGFVEVKTKAFSWKMQIYPNLEDSKCNRCIRMFGPLFCKELTCFGYYCVNCWEECHSKDGFQNHKPVMRNEHKLKYQGVKRNLF